MTASTPEQYLNTYLPLSADTYVDTEKVRTPHSLTPRAERRLLASFVADESGCWLWIRPLEKLGYPRFYNGRYFKAYRVMYERLRGPIPEGLTLDHLCRVRHCVNPWHLEPVTLAENIRRGNSPSALAARKTHCLRGHPLSGDNLLNSSGRKCKTCHRMRGRRTAAA